MAQKNELTELMDGLDAGIYERCACGNCTEQAVIPVRVVVPDGRIGTVWACVPHAENLIARLDAKEKLKREKL